MIVRQREVSTASAWAEHGTPALLQRIYLARGVEAPGDLGRQLTELPSPAQLRGLDTALDILEDALRRQQRVLIVGDYDADGATSTALGVLALGAMGFTQVDFLVPSRFEYGYGLTPEIVDLALTKSPNLLITVDNGISSIDGVDAARAAGLRVIVTDHHLPGSQLPAADAIVNPNQPGCGFPTRNLAGVGVIFFLLTALRTRLRESGWFSEQGIAEPNMATWLDLVALGTVADVVPLDRVNRVLVHQGLQRMRAGVCRPGILALLEVAGRDRARLVASDLGFAVGPRLNAAGRLDDMAHGIHLLLEHDPGHARVMAEELDQLNLDRRVIEAGMQAEALTLLQGLHLEERELPWGLCLYEPKWHQGVVGLLASRIKERFHRPVIAFGQDGNGDLKGSARSIPGFHIRDALDAVAARHPGLLSKFGGHAMAAGLSLAGDRFPQFAAAFDEEVRRQLTEETLEEVILIDAILDPADIHLESARLLREAGPWGQHFPEPLFRGEFHVLDQRVVGGKHLKFNLGSERDRGFAVEAIAFNVPPALLAASLTVVDIVYRLDVNAWRGRESVQLIIERVL
ncbi:MAG: single-stranded-DNA-specific exonuclease RecJ [Bacteroidales bacterium]|nr:single-stranded-DNA-specific exonuclease RecJ [Bacteroidales bacterium]